MEFINICCNGQMTSEQTMSGSIRSISLYRQMRAYHFTPSEMLIAYQQPPTKTKYEPLIRFTPQILILYPCKIDLLYARYAIRLGLRLFPESIVQQELDKIFTRLRERKY